MTAVQRDREWLVDASPEEITAAYNAGELQVALGRDVNAPVQRAEAWVKAATPEQIVAAHEAGELVELLGGDVNALGNPIDGA